MNMHYKPAAEIDEDAYPNKEYFRILSTLKSFFKAQDTAKAAISAAEHLGGQISPAFSPRRSCPGLAWSAEQTSCTWDKEQQKSHSTDTHILQTRSLCPQCVCTCLLSPPEETAEATLMVPERQPAALGVRAQVLRPLFSPCPTNLV